MLERSKSPEILRLDKDQAKEVLCAFDHGTSLISFEVFSARYGAEIRVTLEPVVESSLRAKAGQRFLVEVTFGLSGARTADLLRVIDRDGKEVYQWKEQEGAPTQKDDMRPIVNGVVREALAGIVNQLLAKKIDEANRKAQE